MENLSGLKPLGRAILVRPIELEDMKAVKIVIPDSVRNNSAVMEQRAIVIAVGACAWSDEPEPRAAPGDKVIVTRLAGYLCQGPGDGKIYRMVNDRDIFCKITDEAFLQMKRQEVANG